MQFLSSTESPAVAWPMLLSYDAEGVCPRCSAIYTSITMYINDRMGIYLVIYNHRDSRLCACGGRLTPATQLRDPEDSDNTCGISSEKQPRTTSARGLARRNIEGDVRSLYSLFSWFRRDGFIHSWKNTPSLSYVSRTGPAQQRATRRGGGNA